MAASKWLQERAAKQRAEMEDAGFRSGTGTASKWLQERAAAQRERMGIEQQRRIQSVTSLPVLEMPKQSAQPEAEDNESQKPETAAKPARDLVNPLAYGGIETPESQAWAKANEMPYQMQGERGKDVKVQKAYMDIDAAERELTAMEPELEAVTQEGKQLEERGYALQESYEKLLRLKETYEATGDYTTGQAFLIAVNSYNAQIAQWQKDQEGYAKRAKVVDTYNVKWNALQKKYLDYDEAVTEWAADRGTLNGGGFSANKPLETQKKELPGLGQTAYHQVVAGAGAFDKGIAQTVKLIAEAPMAVEDLLMGDHAFTGSMLKPIVDWADYIIRGADYWKQIADEEAAQYGMLGQVGGALTQGVTGSLPSSLLVLLSGGTSELGRLAPQVVGLAETARQAVMQMFQNPMYWSSVLQTVGSSYQEALDSGANKAEALIAAVLSSLSGAAVEVGSGLEVLPEELIQANGKWKKTLTWLRSGLEEGGEELIQGPLERLINKAFSGSDAPLWSTTDQNAVLNPNVSAQEFAMGAGVGLIHGGGQIMLNSLLSRGSTAQPGEEKLTVQQAAENMQEAYQRFRQTGSEADAAAVLETARVLQRVAGAERKESAAPFKTGTVENGAPGGDVLSENMVQDSGNEVNGEIATSPAVPRNDNAVTEVAAADAISRNDGAEITEGIQWAGNTPEIEAERIVSNERAEQQADMDQDRNRGWESGRTAGYAQRDLRKERARAAVRRAEEASRVQANVQALGGVITSLKEQGLSVGSDSRTLMTVEREAWTPEIEEAWEVADSYGLELVPLVGNMQAYKANGKLVPVLGAIENGRVYVRADSTRATAAETTKHEIYHELEGQDPKLTERLRDMIRKKYTREQTQELLEKYYDDYQNAYGNQLTDEEVEILVWGEMMADAYAEFQRYSAVSMPEEWTGIVQDEVWNKDSISTKEEGRKERFSFAGDYARNQNYSAAAQAREMERNGKDPEEIFRETGYYRGRDGLWRFEIDDSQMRYSRRGDASFRREHPSYDRYRTLVEKKERFMLELSEEALTEEEENELLKLREWWSDTFRRDGMETEGAEPNTMLTDYVVHEELFRAYPELKNTAIVFTKMKDNERGSYDYLENTIRINENLRHNPKKTIIHEIQHAIQRIEGFAGGASPEFWEQKIREGYSVRENDAKIQEADQRYRELFDHAPEALRNMVREINRAKLRDDWNTVLEIEDRIYESEYADLYSELEDANFDRSGDRGRELTADDLYRNTSGEIEARDAANRIDLTQEERRNAFPDLGGSDAVFANAKTARWASKDDYDEESASIKEQIANSLERLNAMDIVASATVPTNLRNKDEAAKWAAEALKTTGYRVDRQGYGEIYFNKNDLDRGLRYADTPEEKAALVLLPKVLKRGIEIGAHGNHKKRKKQTITFAAPVEMNGIRGNLAIVINRHGNNYYAHRIVLPDGTEFRFSEKNKNAARELSRGVTENGSLAKTTSAASEDSVLRDNKKVKVKFSIAEDAAKERLEGKIKPGLPNGPHAVPRSEVEFTGHIVWEEGMSAEEYAELDAAWQERHRPDREGQAVTPVEELTIPKERFASTPAMEKLGIKIDGTVTRYRQTEQLRAYDKAAKQAQAVLRRRIKALNPTQMELALARGLVDRTITAGALNEDNLNVDIILELADYMMAAKSFSNDLIAQRRNEINTSNWRIANDMFQDSEEYHPKLKWAGLTKIVMNERTPERVVKQIFGQEQGQKIFEAYFRPVWVNGSEMNRFENRMLNRVEKFTDANGRKRKLTKEERAMAQRLLEGRAALERVQRLDQDSRERVEAAAQKLNDGMEWLDAVREFNLNDEYRQGVAQAYADYLDTVTMSEGMDQTILDNAIKTYQEVYNELYDAINDFLVSHGYDEIGFIRGYAPHFQKKEVQRGLFGALKALGVEKESVSELPASIAGRTADFKPNMRWNPHMQSRTGNSTSYDIQEGYERYLHYAAEMFYHTDDVMRIRQAVKWFQGQYSGEDIADAIEDAQIDRFKNAEWKKEFLEQKELIEPGRNLSAKEIDTIYDKYLEELFKRAKPESLRKYSEFVTWLDNYANIVAGKQSLADRGLEYGGGRSALNWGSRIMRAFSAANVAGNISSVLNQSAQLPLIQQRLGVYLERAIFDMARGGLAKDNFVERSDFLTDKRGVNKLTVDNTEAFISALFKPAELMDRLVSTLAVRGRYLQALDQKMTTEEAMKEADDFGRRVMGSRMKGAKPLGFESKTFVNQMLHVFQVEAANTFDYMVLSDMPQTIKEIRKTKGKTAAARHTAAYVVGYLMNAFLLNQLTDRLYGGSPAPFDLVGWGLNFAAGAFGLTDDEFMKALIDNVWEKLFGERPFGTEPIEREDGIHWEGALKDLGYNVMNDVPYIRNIMGLMGWGDQTLPTVGVNELFGYLGSAGGTVLQQLFRGEEETGISWAGAAKSAGEDLVNAAALILPSGRQLKKTAQGLTTLLQGGRYSGDRLQYPVERNIWNAIQAGLFGPSALAAADAYYAAEKSPLTAGQSKVVQELEDLGINRFVTYELYQEFREIGKELTGTEASTAKRNAINALPLTDQEKLEVYSAFIMDQAAENYEKNLEQFQGMLDAGLTWDQVTQAHNTHADLNDDEEMTATQKATEFAKWVDTQDINKEQRTALEEKFKFWNMMPAQAANYEKFEQAGIEPEKAADLASVVGGLEPESGRDYITDAQKILAIDGSELTEEERIAAISAMVPDRREKLVSAGVEAENARRMAAELAVAEAKNGEEDLSLIQKTRILTDLADSNDEALAAVSTVMQETTYGKLEVADAYGVTVADWVQYREAWSRTYGEDSVSQDKVRNVLDRMHLTERKKAVLWQLANKSWKPKNNPYDTDIGEDVYYELSGE